MIHLVGVLAILDLVTEIMMMKQLYLQQFQFLFERLLKDSAITMRYINTKQQLADMFTKGSSTEITWKTLLTLVQIGAQQ